MTCWLLIFLCAVIGCMADPECGPNELLDNCPVECASDYCPKSEKEAQLSCPPIPKKCSPPACKCRVNYRRVSQTNRTCIPTRECPSFKCKGLNQEYNPCPSLCPTDSCTQATPDGSCPRLFGHILILLICSPTCRCKKNYWRQDGICIPYSECPQNLKPNNATDVPQPAITAPNLPGASPQDDAAYIEYTLPQESAASSYATATATASSDCSSASANTASNAGSSEKCGSSPKTQNLKPNNATYETQPAITAQNVPGASSQDDGAYIEYTSSQKSAASSYATATATASSDCSSASANTASNAGSSEKCGSPPKTQCSGQNEEYVLEKQSCPGEQCFVITARINCTDAPPPQPGCACKSGYFRLNETSPCIHMCECPQMANALECKDYAGGDCDD